MQIKSNTLLKVIVPVVLLSSVAIGVKSCGGAKQAQETTDNAAVADLTQEELRILGIEGDTPQDTLRTLVGRIKTIQTSQENLAKQNTALSEENARLQNKGTNVDGRINDAVNAVKQESTQAQQKLQAEQQRLAGLLESLKNAAPGPGTAGNLPGNSELPVGLGLEDAGAGEVATQGTVWIEPQDGVQLDRNGKPVAGAAVATSGTGTFQFPTAFGGLNDNEITRQKAELDRNAKNQQSIEETDLPVYTLPENATLVGSQAMTALLGRVPIDGKVTDPYPFKVLIGKENLTANGIELPDVEGAIVSGTATGDWVLSCVRGEVHSITFVFTDGTVRTVPQPAKSSDGSNGKSNGGSIGWLSDEHGIPCLSGDRKSNASTYLPTLFALSAAGAASDAMSESQTTTTTEGTSITSTLTGSAGQAAMGKALSGGTNELAEWVKARYGQMFDAIYVPPGAQVAVHITRQIPIDYEEKGRKVKYDFDVSQQHELD
ncbi:TIGR03752 family integrating conjugative element protein [Edwardsiella ictaluri]|uniref:TIGR03752 family integrating conjugative element protein n=1 Tax=Edwardsiella ictaluri TaxID=67780 RepID=A0ABY8GK72_EDWIC|nr:TIGR03752 family integrating conjugative element protein [Edwardsiella ictaluri]ELV7529325.1 TIGR03752 family integrating conjugative element protein [Edwardsiella ictaluri]KOO54097.1 bacterial conjugation TrbI-like family protein [Edwardsiella ictaluri]WFN97929.1 TIGR03752 family integrating conjugative element protein [Edwardsiella ictaluri]